VGGGWHSLLPCKRDTGVSEVSVKGNVDQIGLRHMGEKNDECWGSQPKGKGDLVFEKWASESSASQESTQGPESPNALKRTKKKRWVNGISVRKTQ